MGPRSTTSPRVELCLYKVLGVQASADEAEIKRA